MKLNFKTLLIVFLVALLGSSIGTFVTKELVNENGSKTSSNLNVSQVEYENVELSSYTQAINKVYDTVVQINVGINYRGQTVYSGAGSGVIISSDGYVVTNNHVVTSAEAFKVILSDGSEYEAYLIGTDPRSDIALLKIDAQNLSYASFADSNQIVIGEQVIAIGNPLGEGITVSEGIISSLSKDITIKQVSMDLLQTTAAINEGNSGGGLFDLNGNIVGIVNAKSSSSLTTTVEGMGYAIPSNTALKVVMDLKDYGYVKDRATLGVSIYTSNTFFYSSEGAIISEVSEGGAAQKAGIQAGDVIIDIDDNPITNYTDMTRVLSKYSVGDKVKVTISRDGKQMDFNVTLTEVIMN